jgi:hypothetical protein
VWSVGDPPPPPRPSEGGRDPDRRWDGPVEWETGDDPKPEGRFGGAGGTGATAVVPPGLDDGPAVRILGPEPPPGPTDDPQIRFLDGRTSLLVADAPARSTTENGAGAVAVQTAAAPRLSLADNGAAPAVALEPKPKPARQKPPPLAVVPTPVPTRPHGRLGALWVAITVGTLVPGVAPVAVWLAACSGVAGLQTAKVWRARGEHPLIPLAAGIAAALPLSAIWGLRAMTGTVAIAVILTLLARLFSLTKAPARDVGLTLAIGVVIGLAAASVVLLRNTGLQAPLLLLTFAAAYDASAYVVGTGAGSAWEGPAAGVAMLIPVTMLAAVVLVPPFPEASPLLLGLMAAVLAPCGPLAGSALLGERDANAPALRRLDSLLVMAPLWSWCAAAFLR